jgi:MazG family protein
MHRMPVRPENIYVRLMRQSETTPQSADQDLLVRMVEGNVEWSVVGKVCITSMAATRKKPVERQKNKSGAPRAIAGKRAGANSLVPAKTGAWFARLAAVQARLRAPKGCPWDREQTHQSLRTYLIEEAYEVLEAMESGDDEKFADELGDLLLQVLFHADIAREAGRFDVVDVIRAIHDKMIRRHPHVFGDVTAKNSVEVLRNWDRIKAEERRAAEEYYNSGNGSGKPNGVSPATESPASKPAPSLLDGVTRGLPATLEGFQLTRKASRIGFDWDAAQGVLAKVREESAELESALTAKDRAGLEEEMGDLLFAAVNLARFLKIDPEIALKRANGKFSSRFRAMEAMARAGGRELASAPRDEMEKFWNTAKRHEKRSPNEFTPGSAGVSPAGLDGAASDGAALDGARQVAVETPALHGKRRSGKRHGANP